MNDPATSLSIVKLFVNADPVVKGELLLLLAASVWSWAVIIDKLWRLSAASRSARGHEARAAEAGSDRQAGSARILDIDSCCCPAPARSRHRRASTRRNLVEPADPPVVAAAGRYLARRESLKRLRDRRKSSGR